MAALAGIGCLGALALAASPAAAHTELVSSSPKDGSTLVEEPTSVTLTFDQTLRPPAYAVVTAPDGARLSRVDPEVAGATVTQRVETSGLSGSYTVAYRVVTGDGHPITGELTYTVTSGEQSAEPPPTPVGEGSFWTGHWAHALVALGGVLIAFGIAPLWQRRA